MFYTDVPMTYPQDPAARAIVVSFQVGKCDPVTKAFIGQPVKISLADVDTKKAVSFVPFPGVGMMTCRIDTLDSAGNVLKGGTIYIQQDFGVPPPNATWGSEIIWKVS